MKQLIVHFLCIKLLKAVLQDQNVTHNYFHLKRKTKWHEIAGLVYIFCNNDLHTCFKNDVPLHASSAAPHAEGRYDLPTYLILC